jgi:hypothetical protein
MNHPCVFIRTGVSYRRMTLSGELNGLFKVIFTSLEEAFIWAGLETELERNLEKEKN